MLQLHRLAFLLYFLAFSIASLVAQTRPDNRGPLVGTWKGNLGNLHLSLNVRHEAGSYAGELNSIDQHTVLQMENIELNGESVRFEVNQVGGLYVGSMAKDGQSIAGTWTQTGVPAQVLMFRRESTDKTGNRSPTDSLEVVPLDVLIPARIIAFKADGRWDLAYELRISNFADHGEYTITRVEVLDANGNAAIPFSGEALRGMTDSQSSVGTTLGPHTFTTLFMWLSASSLDEMPPTLRHRVTVKAGESGKEIATDTAAVPIERRPVIVIGPPLRGNDWVAMNGPSNISIHRRSIIPIGGGAHIGQRFAIDWARVYPDGAWAKGDLTVNKNFRGYGENVYAVADGVVTEVKDGIPENVPGTNSRAVSMTFENVAGNHVILKVGEELFAAFAHLQPGSIRVKVGDKIQEGQVLGLVGNSGNSTAPHLHFQICDKDSVLNCEGVPYALRSFEVRGQWKPGDKMEQHQNELPTAGEVVSFGSK